MTSLDEGNVYYQNQGPFEGTQVDAADDGAPAMSRHTAKRKFREFLAAYKDATTDEMIYRERCETLRNAEDAHKVSQQRVPRASCTRPMAARCRRRAAQAVAHGSLYHKAPRGRRGARRIAG